MSCVRRDVIKQRAVNQQKQAWCLDLLLGNEAKRGVRERDSDDKNKPMEKAVNVWGENKGNE